MKKRIVSFLLALVMAVSLLPVSAFAVEDGVSPDASAVAGQLNDDIVDSGVQVYATDTRVETEITPVITYTMGSGSDSQTASLVQFGTREFKTGSKKRGYKYTVGRVWIASLPAGAKITDVFFGADAGYKDFSVYNAKGMSGGESYEFDDTKRGQQFERLLQGKKDYLVNNAFSLENINQFLVPDKNTTLTLVDDVAIPTEDVQGVLVTYTYALKANEAVLIQISTAGQTIDKSALKAALDSVPTTGYYTENDCWNGKATSETGFWNDLCTIVQQAQELYDNESISQEQYDKVAPGLITALQAAIANLISTSRVNATALYEALHTDWRWNPGNSLQEGWPENTLWEKPSADNCTPLSWQPYAKAVKDGQALLDKLYENGKPTEENTDAKQETVDRLAAAADAHKLVNKEAYAAAYDKYMAAKPEAEALLKQYDPAKLTERDFTADSWKTYTDAYAALEADVAYRIVGGTTEDWKMLQGFNGYYAYDDAGQWTHYIAHIEALKNAYRALTSGVDVTVSFTYLNNFSALYPSFGGTSLYANSSLTLAAGSTDLAGLMAQAGLTFDLHAEGSIRGGCDTIPYFLLLVNGENFGVFSRGQIPQKAVQFHHGDDIRMFRIQSPLEKTEASSGYDSTAIFTGNAVDASSYRDSIALINMKTPADVKVGDKVKLSATVIGADLFNLGQSKSAEGITLFISDPAETKTLSQPTHKTTAVTGADGSLQYVFTRPGWYTVAMFNVTPDELTFTSVYNAVTIGTYYSLYGGDYALIHVTDVDDTAALLEQYRAENLAKAKAYVDSFHDYDFAAADYAAFQAQYETLAANLNAATDLTGLMETFDADFARLKELGAAAYDHAAVIAGLRQNMSYLPDDLNDLNAYYKQLVKDIQTVYGGLNSYQKKLLSANETKRLDAVAKIDAEDLKALAKVTVNVTVKGTLPTTGGTGGAANYGWPNLTWSMAEDVDGTVPVPKWAKVPSSQQGTTLTSEAGSHVFVRRYMPNTTDDAYWMAWSLDNENWSLSTPQTLTNMHGAEYPGYYLVEYVVPDDVVDGSTINITLKMISKTDYQAMTADSEEAVTAAKSAALSRLETLYNSLGDKAKVAYDDGVKSINAAASVTAVESAYQSAVVAMKKAADNYGKVRVIVENRTFPKADWGKNETYWYGEAANEEIPLTADSTMMSCVVEALKRKHFTQTGAEDGYISSITDPNGNALAEFNGGKGSGWMGTLNDWFTNYGFAAFTVANGKLADGDVIRIMYTRNLGVDLDGTWGNSDTTLKALDVEGGKLLTEFVPGEIGGSYEYVLAIKGASADIQLTPTAANKNFLTKIFLNEKVTDNTEGSSFYKRTQTIPVKAGDVIYVGCGARAWPTMNNQAGNTQKNDGTWYVLRVIDVNADASAVTGMINDLPEVSAVKYGNYQLYMNAVAAARASFNALSKEQQKLVDTTELEKLETAIAQFQAIDEVKDQLDKLPSAGDLTIKDRDAVKAAKDAYDKLTPEQKAELTGLEIDKMGELTTRMDEIIKENPTPTPTPGGNTGNNSSAKNPYQKDNGKDVKSGNTGDAGITLYVGMGLVAVLAGAVIVTRKRKEN